MITVPPAPFAPVERLKQANALMDSLAALPASADDVSWRLTFIELISLTDAILNSEERQGRRVAFYEEVGVGGKIQDVTSLVNWLHSHMPDSADEANSLPTTARLNRYIGQGTGYFANGAFFSSDHSDEIAFFLDNQRVYLDRHLRRALNGVANHSLAA